MAIEMSVFTAIFNQINEFNTIKTKASDAKLQLTMWRGKWI